MAPLTKLAERVDELPLQIEAGKADALAVGLELTVIATAEV